MNAYFLCQEARRLARACILAAAALLLWAAGTLANRAGGGTQDAAPVPPVSLSSVCTMEVSRQGETLHYQLDGGRWICSEYPEYTLDQALLGSMAQTAAQFVPTAHLEDSAGYFERFGLSAPQVTVTAGNGRGGYITYRLGIYNDTLDQTYLAYDGWEDAYLVRQADAALFQSDLLALLERFEVPRMKSVTDIEIICGSDSFRILPRGDDPLLKLEGVSLQADGLYPNPVPVDSSETSLLLAILQAMDPERVGYIDSDEKMERYGFLDVSAGSICIHAATFQYTLLISGAGEDGRVYACSPNDKILYYLGPTLSQTMQEYLDGRRLLLDSLAPLPAEAVKGLSVTVDGIPYQIVMDETAGVYQVNGRQVDTELFRQFYQELSALSAETYTDQVAQETPLQTNRQVIVTYQCANGVSYTLRLTPYSSSYDLAEFGGIDNRLVSIRDVNALKTSLKNLLLN